ncbi:hypothetical protein HanPSC8_Chr17g0787901 [Helianthus annuus]|nr:hypothetical protein HanPSC8_Chr17g0787901 [Helianthus annuus]
MLNLISEFKVKRMNVFGSRLDREIRRIMSGGNEDDTVPLINEEIHQKIF